jgi:hypothetical protein
MDKELIEQWARQVGVENGAEGLWVATDAELARFAAIAFSAGRAAGLEEAAKVADERAASAYYIDGFDGEYESGIAVGAKNIATRIRALKAPAAALAGPPATC